MSNTLRHLTLRRSGLALVLALAMSTAVALHGARREEARAAARLNVAAAQLDSLTDGTPADDSRRAAIAWGYAERLRIGLESPFRLVEAAARDPRLTPEERHVVSWALLSRVLRGETHDVEPASLDGIGPTLEGVSVAGEQHVELIERTVAPADDPRAAELAVRLAYTLATTERILDASAVGVAAEAAALIADRELARREAAQVVRAADGGNPIDVVRRRRAARTFYVERPVMLAPSADVERAAIEMVPDVLAALRRLAPAAPDTRVVTGADENALALAPGLFTAGAYALPSAPLTVTVRRYLPLVRAQAPRMHDDGLANVRNAEMLLAATRIADATRPERRAIGRMLLAAGVAMRSVAQEPVWFPGDSAPSADQVQAEFALGPITFDSDVPAAWRPYYLMALQNGVADLRRVFPTLRIEGLQVRFRMDAPADSALAMHDPRTRTLHLPVVSAGGTLSHELAHDLDRQSAQQLGLAGYRSDIVARVAERPSAGSANRKLAASLRALTEEVAEASSGKTERPAEIFATRVDWFVAGALARLGRSNGFLSAAQDEMLTGHVVHPQRLRNFGRSRSLLSALEEMTTVAAFAVQEPEPSVHTLLRWALNGPVDRGVAGEILRGTSATWETPALATPRSCGATDGSRASLVRLAAESRARGWVRLRARWTEVPSRPAWARAALGQAPWSDSLTEMRVAELGAHILETLAFTTELPTGLAGYAAGVAAKASGC